MIPNAKEAKRQSELNAIVRLQEKKTEQRTAIKNKILQAIELGETSISYSGDVYDEIVAELHEAGYSINKNYYDNKKWCHEVIIKWDDAK